MSAQLDVDGRGGSEGYKPEDVTRAQYACVSKGALKLVRGPSAQLIQFDVKL